MEEHLREEQQRRSLAERQVQLLEQKVTSKFSTQTEILHTAVLAYSSCHSFECVHLQVCVEEHNVCICEYKVISVSAIIHHVY